MGQRGEGWVIAQGVLFTLIALSPRTGFLWLAPRLFTTLGMLLIVVGLFLLMWGVFGLGRNLTPFPRPISEGQLVTTGVYGIVRHPLYGGLILASLGFALLTTNLVRIVLTLVLSIFFDAKSRREEAWLEEVYVEYTAYQQRVKKFIPWLY